MAVHPRNPINGQFLPEPGKPGSRHGKKRRKKLTSKSKDRITISKGMRIAEGKYQKEAKSGRLIEAIQKSYKKKPGGIENQRSAMQKDPRMVSAEKNYLGAKREVSKALRPAIKAATRQGDKVKLTGAAPARRKRAGAGAARLRKRG